MEQFSHKQSSFCESDVEEENIIDHSSNEKRFKNEPVNGLDGVYELRNDPNFEEGGGSE